MQIVANELKKRGATALASNLKNNKEVFINVRGKNTYVVMKVEDYNRYREYELEQAIRDSKADLEAGCYSKESVEEHIRNITTD